MKRKRRELKKVEVTDELRRQLERLWFIYVRHASVRLE